MWLREEFGNRAYFPDSSSKFQFPSNVGRSVISLMVEGALPVSQTQAVPCSTPLSLPQQSSSSTSHPVYKPIFSAKKEPTVSVKVVQATMSKTSSGKTEFQRQGQLFIDVTESTANVPYISNAIQKKWGNDYMLVTVDGLEIDDSAGTQGRNIIIVLHLCI